MADTTTTTVAEVIEREAYAASVLYFDANLGLKDFVTVKDISGDPTLVARFPIYDSVSATAIAEATDFTTNSALDTTGTVDVTISEHIIKFTITDLSQNAARDTLYSAAGREASIVGQMGAQALAQRLDQDISALFSAFNSSTGDYSAGITSTLLMSAIYTLDINNIPVSPRTIALHPFQWKSLAPVFDDAAVFGAQGQEIVRSGRIAQLYGCAVFQTSNIATATISSSTDWTGAVFHPSAIAVAHKALANFEVERDASLRAFEVVGTGVWGEAEYRGGATTSGRGGAGVLLYSNSTVV